MSFLYAPSGTTSNLLRCKLVYGKKNEMSIIKRRIFRKFKNVKRIKSIIVTEIKTGIETRFDTLTEASKFYDVKITSICNVLSGLSKTFKKKQYIVKYE